MRSAAVKACGRARFSSVDVTPRAGQDLPRASGSDTPVREFDRRTEFATATVDARVPDRSTASQLLGATQGLAKRRKGPSHRFVCSGIQDAVRRLGADGVADDQDVAAAGLARHGPSSKQQGEYHWVVRNLQMITRARFCAPESLMKCEMDDAANG